MSSRRPLAPQAVIGKDPNTGKTLVSGDMSADITSQVTIIQSTSMLSYDISWTGATPIGTMVVQVSNSYSQNADGTVKNPGNWTDLVLSAATPVSGNTGNGFIDIDELGAYAVRLQYRRTSGTGTMIAVISGKVA